jgi:ion channel-forming bestrophin family protein
MTSVIHEEKKAYRKSHLRRFGGWASSSDLWVASTNQPAPQIDPESSPQDPIIKYHAFPLVRDMLLHEKERRRNLEQNGCKQIFYPKSTDGWLKSLLVLEGRALDQFIYPWLLVSLHAVAWTLISEFYLTEQNVSELDTFQSILGLMLSSALSFLLVFRLNRSAERFWMARMAWGIIIASSRSLVGGVLTHSSHDLTHRDEVIRWVAAFSVSLTHFMRKVPQDHGTMLGILSEDEMQQLGTLAHPPLFVAEKIRDNLAKAFYYDENTPLGVAHGRSQRLATLERELDILILQMGALERIQATPLPLVYVTHLRTFLLCFLFSIPYVWQASLGYGTIPFVVIIAYAMLGLEGAAMECESPFKKGRPNHLNMDAFCMIVLRDVTQLIKSNADMEIESLATTVESS